MKNLPEEIIRFLQSQGYVIVATVDKQGFPHASCKGILKIEPQGRIYLLDVYRASTFENLKQNDHLSLTAVDEHKFVGYCLKGKVKMLQEEDLTDSIIKAWEEKIASRLTQRLLRNIREEKGHRRHPEALLPNPQYLIAMEVEEIVDLTPRHLK